MQWHKFLPTTQSNHRLLNFPYTLSWNRFVNYDSKSTNQVQRHVSILLQKQQKQQKQQQQYLVSKQHFPTHFCRKSLNDVQSIHRVLKRSYIFFPTSWKEFEIRFLRNFRKQRTVYVSLIKDKVTFQNMQSKLQKYYKLVRRAYLNRKGMTISATNKLSSSSSTTTTTSIPVPILSTTTIKSPIRNRSMIIARTRRHLRDKKLDISKRWKETKHRWKETKHRWKLHTVAMKNHFIRRTRHYKDRVQRIMNRQLTRIATSYNHVFHDSNTTKATDNNNQIITKKSILITEYSESSWFCPITGRPITSKDATGRYVNPWLSESTAGVKSITDVMKWQCDRIQRTSKQFWEWIINSNTLRVASSMAIEKSLTQLQQQQNQSNNNQSITPYTKNNNMVSSSDDEMKLTWIGHSTCLLQHDTISILTDPIFSDRCSPFQNLPIGVGRDIPPGISINDLPPQIDICLISHDHYDHLDLKSIIALQSHVQIWIVPLGIKEWIHLHCNIPNHNIIELEWWESVKIRKTIDNTNSNSNNNNNNSKWEIVRHHSAIKHPTEPHPSLIDIDIDNKDTNNTTSDDTIIQQSQSIWITCCPVQHWCSRTFLDRNFRLWCSYAVFFQNQNHYDVSNIKKFYFGGDTALPNNNFPLFQQISDYIGGNIDLAAIPIGAYEPSFFMSDSHINPKEAVQIHQILDIKQSIGIHWGTFALSEEPIDEPPMLLRAAAEQANVNFTTMRQGDMITVKCQQSGHISLVDKDRIERVS